MRKKIGALLATIALTVAPIGLGVATATPASATHTCVDNYEWNNFDIGSGKNAVERLFDTRGWTAWSSGNIWVKKYYACGSYYDIVKVKYYWNGYRWLVQNAWRY